MVCFKSLGGVPVLNLLIVKPISIKLLVKWLAFLKPAGPSSFISSPINYVDENDNRYLLPSGVVNLDGDKIYTYLHYKNSRRYKL